MKSIYVMLFMLTVSIANAVQAGCIVETCIAPGGRKYCCDGEALNPNPIPVKPVISGFSCMEQDSQGQAESTKLSIHLGSPAEGIDITQINTTNGILTFQSKYNYTSSPVYRWGYFDLYDSNIEGLGQVHVSVKNLGPEPDFYSGEISAVIYGLEKVRSFTCRLLKLYELSSTQKIEKMTSDRCCQPGHPSHCC